VVPRQAEAAPPRIEGREASKEQSARPKARRVAP
jgi:hypothetical protein